MKLLKRRYVFPDGTNYPILESSTGVMLLVRPSDIVKAEEKDPCACALAQCAMRLGYEKAYIAGSVAYLVTLYRGAMVAVKYSVPMRTRTAIKAFDESHGKLFPAEGFMLGALQVSRTSAVKKVENARRTPEQRRWTGQRGGVRPELRTFRHLTGHVRTVASA